MFVRNLAWKADERMVREAMGKFGEVDDVYLPPNKEDGGGVNKANPGSLHTKALAQRLGGPPRSIF